MRVKNAKKVYCYYYSKKDILNTNSISPYSLASFTIDVVSSMIYNSDYYYTPNNQIIKEKTNSLINLKNRY